MVATNALVLFFILSVSLTSCLEDFEHQKTIVKSIVSLVKYLASNQAGIFDCWLYHACTDPPGRSRLMQDIYVGLEHEAIARLATNARFNWSTVFKRERLPSLVIIYLEYLNENRTIWSNIGQLIGSLTSQSRIVMITGVEQRKILDDTFIPTFANFKLYNVAFLFIDKPLAIAPHFIQRRYYSSNTLWPPEDMFPDQARSFEGQPFRIGFSETSILNSCSTSDCIGYDASIAKEIVRYLNATAQFVRFVCPYEVDEKNDNVYNCIHMVAYQDYCAFDFFIEPAASELFEGIYIEIPLPYDNVLLAPNGRSLNIAELFLRPFQFELWLLFFIGMITIKVMSLMLAKDFKNDPLFMPICGFEQCDLNQTSRKEKLVMITLIVLFFFISNAYETKIISLMSNKPRVPMVSTLESILESGTKVKGEYHAGKRIPILKSLYDSSNINEDELDGTSVYFVNGDVGKLLVQRTINWDYESNQPRYRIMDEKFALGVVFYPIPLRSSARPHIRFVVKALFESGILVRWRHEYMVKSNTDRFPLIKPGGVNPTSDILYFSDLIPAWFVVLCGSLISLGVLIVEILYTRRFKVD